MCRRVLKPGGTIWISGTLAQYLFNRMALQQERYKIINNLPEENKPAAQFGLPLLHSFHRDDSVGRKDEKKARHLFNYEQMKQMNGGNR